jgi:hypothetical protein
MDLRREKSFKEKSESEMLKCMMKKQTEIDGCEQPRDGTAN